MPGLRRGAPAWVPLVEPREVRPERLELVYDDRANGLHFAVTLGFESIAERQQPDS